MRLIEFVTITIQIVVANQATGGDSVSTVLVSGSVT